MVWVVNILSCKASPCHTFVIDASTRTRICIACGCFCLPCHSCLHIFYIYTIMALWLLTTVQKCNSAFVLFCLLYLRIWITCSQPFTKAFLMTFSPVFSPFFLGTAAGGEDDNETPVTYESTLWHHLTSSSECDILRDFGCAFTPRTFELSFSHRVALCLSIWRSAPDVCHTAGTRESLCIYSL